MTKIMHVYRPNDVFFPQAPGDSSARLVPGEVKTRTNKTRMDPKLSPSNSQVIAFVHRNDLWVSNVASKTEKRLTWTNSGRPSVVDEAVSAGVPSFVVQEEFDRYTGYWWKPKIEEDNEEQVNRYCILYEEVSKSTVDFHVCYNSNTFCNLKPLIKVAPQSFVIACELVANLAGKLLI